MNEFDLKAKDWDKNRLNLERAQSIAGYLTDRIKFRPGMKAMEFGAGTALLSFELKDLFKSIALLDNSKEMIRICDQKISETQSDHIHTVLIDLEKVDLDEKYDIIYSQMAFHHLIDIENILKKLHQMLNNDGVLAIADLFTEDGSFHGEGFTGHNGFDPDWLASLLKKAGFVNIRWEQCFIQKKIDAFGAINDYLVFMIFGEVLNNSSTVK